MRAGLFLYRYRSYTPLPLLAVALAFGHPTIASIGAGLLCAVCGEALRLWGVHTAGPLTRMTAQPGGDELMTHGPYAYVRNPLYIGNIAIYTGVGIMANAWWIAVAGAIYFLVQYGFIIREEERYLAGQYGDRYAAYLRSVRRFLPGVTAYRDGSTPRLRLSVSDTLRSERRTLQAIVTATMLMALLAFIRA